MFSLEANDNGKKEATRSYSDDKCSSIESVEHFLKVEKFKERVDQPSDSMQINRYWNSKAIDQNWADEIFEKQFKKKAKHLA